MGTTIDPTAAIRRLLVRTGFAASPDGIASATAAGFSATLDRILSGTTDVTTDAAVTPLPTLAPVASRADGPQPADP